MSWDLADRTLGMWTETPGTTAKLFGVIHRCLGKQKKWLKVPELRAGKLFSCVSPVGHGNTRKCQIWAEIGKWYEDIILLPCAESDTGGNFARDEKGGEN